MVIDSYYSKSFISDSLSKTKLKEIKNFAILINNHKNLVSQEVNNNLSKYIDLSFFDFLKLMRAKYKGIISSNFDKQLYLDIYNLYQSKFEAIQKKIVFEKVTFKGFEYYKRDGKNNTKGDLKRVIIAKEKTKLSIVLGYLARYGNDKIIEYIESQLNKSDLEEIELLFPTEKKEQQKIADILSSVDSAIESTSKIISKQKRIKTALMQDLLTHGIDENGKIRSEQTHEYKDSPLGWIPAEWDNTTIGEECLVRDGTHQTPKYVESGVPFYSVETITNNDFTKVKFISEQEHKELTKNYRIEKDDVLMTRIGSIGDCKYTYFGV
jgi:restriction endonuclease S subunit